MSYETFFAQYMDYPLEVIIETTGRCNARCIFCPHSTLTRKDRYMSDDLFLSIIRQLEEIPQTHRFYISPFKVNELLMDKQIFERIACINQRLPNAYIRIFSNFNAVNEDIISKFAQIQNLSDIDISINSLDADEYQRLMGLELDKTLKNVCDFLSYIRLHGIRMQKPVIILSRVSQDAQTDARFLQSFQTVFSDYLDMVAPQVLPRQEWIDFIPSQAPLKQNQPCARWADINICCTGVVAFCCMDGRAAFPLGNVLESSVLEIYNQPAYKRLRAERPHKAQVMPCMRCSQ